MKEKRYDNDYPSVTEVLNVLRKFVLEIWFKNNTSSFIKAESEKGKAIGKTLHEVISNHIEKKRITLETKYPKEVEFALKSFMLFKKEHPEVKLKRAEKPLTSKKYKFNGTPDCDGRIKEEIIFDWKTGKCYVGTKKEVAVPKIYDDHIYQVSAYVPLYNEANKKRVRQAGIVALATDKIAYNYLLLAEKVINETFSEIFLPALRICNYQNKMKGGK